MSYELNPVQAATTPEWDLVDCLKRGGQPNFDLYTYVRWVGTQWSERNYAGSGGGSGPWVPVTLDIATSWLPLFSNSGQLITYGIGGIELQGNYSAVSYLGPWYSNIDIYIPSYPAIISVGGSMDVFYLYAANPTEPLRTNNTNYGFSFGRLVPDTSNFAESRGQWELANGDYEVIETWEGYSSLRPT